MTSATLETIERLARAAEKLLLETERLRRDVATLAERIEPRERLYFYEEAAPLPARRRSVVDSMNLIENARTVILNAEHHVSAIRGRMDNIAAEAISREEMRPYLK